MIRYQFYIKGSICLLLFLLVAAGCNFPGSAPSGAQTAPAASLVPGSSPEPSGTGPSTAAPTPVEPTATPQPLAAKVDGLEISLADYQAELAQAQKAKGTDLAPEDKQHVLDDLVDQALLARAAEQQGFKVDEALLQQRVQRLSDQLGGQPALHAWVVDHGYDDQSFLSSLARSIAAAWMRDQIAGQVPAAAEQVHVRQILLYNADAANEVISQIKAGNDFGNLAVKYDPITRGDLGWFPRGYLVDPKLEEAAFALQPDATSEVIQTLAGYHILQLLERDPQHPLSPQARHALQIQAVQAWLQQQRSQAQIQVLLP
jgi:peptidyl-prolyl cis-trans isomerase C